MQTQIKFIVPFAYCIVPVDWYEIVSAYFCPPYYAVDENLRIFKGSAKFAFLSFTIPCETTVNLQNHVSYVCRYVSPKYLKVS